MKRVVIVTTGGTIASTSDRTGAKVSTESGDDLVTEAVIPADVLPVVVDVGSINSYAMTFADMDRVHEAVRAALSDPVTVGVVVTHGTDTMEETAMLVDVFHHDVRPVVFTGAQRSSDDVDSDGPSNLRDAITVAASTSSRDLGALISFGGALHSARGTRKVHTNDPNAFLDPNNGPLGSIVDGSVRVDRAPGRMTPLPADPDRIGR